MRELLRRVDFPWTLGLSVAAVVMTTAALWAGDTVCLWTGWAVADVDAIAGGHLWRLASGPLIHTNDGHLLRDVASIAIVGAVYEKPLGRQFPVAAAAGLVLPAAVVLLVNPELGAYYGLSGTFNTLFVAAFIYELRRSRGRPPWWVMTIAGVYGIKLVVEGVTGSLLFDMELGTDVVAAPLAHLVGAAVGATVGILMPREPRPPQREPIAQTQAPFSLERSR